MDLSVSQLLLFFLRLSAFFVLGFFLLYSLFTQQLNGFCLVAAAVACMKVLSLVFRWVDHVAPPDVDASEAYCFYMVSENGVVDNERFAQTSCLLGFVLGCVVYFMDKQKSFERNLPLLFGLVLLTSIDMFNNMVNRCFVPKTGAAAASAAGLRDDPGAAASSIFWTVIHLIGAVVFVGLYVTSFLKGWPWITGVLSTLLFLGMTGSFFMRSNSSADWVGWARVVAAAFAGFGLGAGYAYGVSRMDVPALQFFVGRNDEQGCSVPTAKDIIFPAD